MAYSTYQEIQSAINRGEITSSSVAIHGNSSHTENYLSSNTPHGNAFHTSQFITVNDLPFASTTVMGVVKVDGTSIRLNHAGAIEVVGASINVYGIPVANQVTVWHNQNTVKGGSNLTWDGDSLYAAAADVLAGKDVIAYSDSSPTGSYWDNLPAATSTTIGGFILDATQMEMNAGVLSIIDGVLIPDDHEHSWADITSGTQPAPISHTLEGHTTTVTSGQFLKGTGVNTFAWGAHDLTYTDVGAIADPGSSTDREILTWANNTGDAVRVSTGVSIAADYSVLASGDVVAYQSGAYSGSIWDAIPVTKSIVYTGGYVQLDGDLTTPTDGYVYGYTTATGKGWYAASGGTTSPLTTKGDIWVYTTTDARLPIGATNGHVLTVDSAEASGMKWAAVSGGSSQWTTSGSNIYFTGGNVTIGSSDSAAKLGIYGSEATAHGTAAGIALINTATGGANWTIRAGATGTYCGAGTLSFGDTAYRVIMKGDYTEFRGTGVINGAGYFGISVIDPVYNYPGMYFQGAAGNHGYIRIDNGNGFQFQTVNSSTNANGGTMLFSEAGSLEVTGSIYSKGTTLNVNTNATSNTGYISFGLADVLLGYDSGVFKHKHWVSGGYSTVYEISASGTGYFGIGITPTYKFHVNSAVGSAWLARFTNSSTGGGDIYLCHMGYGMHVNPGSAATVNTYGLYVVTSTGDAGLWVGGTGYVGIGNSTPGSLLTVGSSTSSASSYWMHVAGGNSYGIVVRSNTVGVYAEGSTHAFYGNGAIVATGEITAYYSDIRLKTNIQPIRNALEKINNLKGFTYTANELSHELTGADISERKVGISAQDLQAVLPEAVRLAPFDTLPEEGKKSKSGENYLTVQYEKVVPLLIEAIKELKQEIEELKTKWVGNDTYTEDTHEVI